MQIALSSDDSLGCQVRDPTYFRIVQYHKKWEQCTDPSEELYFHMCIDHVDTYMPYFVSYDGAITNKEGKIPRFAIY